jgi:nitrogen-specific signal transduction histidine kinase
MRTPWTRRDELEKLFWNLVSRRRFVREQLADMLAEAEAGDEADQDTAEELLVRLDRLERLVSRLAARVPTEREELDIATSDEVVVVCEQVCA